MYFLKENYKSLTEFTDKELLEYLDNNENIQLKILAGICSEVLRRMNEREGFLKKSGNYENQ